MNKVKYSISNAIIVVLVLLMILLSLTFAMNINDSLFYSYIPSTSSLSWLVEDHDYDSLAIRVNTIDLKTAQTSDYLPYFALGKYFEMASLYKACLDNEALATNYLKQMAFYYEQSGALQICIPEIHQQLDINPMY